MRCVWGGGYGYARGHFVAFRVKFFQQWLISLIYFWIRIFTWFALYLAILNISISQCFLILISFTDIVFLNIHYILTMTSLIYICMYILFTLCIYIYIFLCQINSVRVIHCLVRCYGIFLLSLSPYYSQIPSFAYINLLESHGRYRRRVLLLFLYKTHGLCRRRVL